MAVAETFVVSSENTGKKDYIGISALARNCGVSIDDIRIMNPHLDDASAKIGQKVTYVSRSDEMDAINFCKREISRLQKQFKSEQCAKFERAIAALKARPVQIVYSKENEDGIFYLDVLKYAKLYNALMEKERNRKYP